MLLLSANILQFLLFCALINSFLALRVRHINSNSHSLSQSLLRKATISLAPVQSSCKFLEKSTRLRSSGQTSNNDGEEAAPSAFEKVASMGLAGVLAITLAEAIFWAAGMPLAELWYKFTTGEWIDLTTQDGQLKAAGFSFGYGGFATLILQYRVTIFAIPLVPIMDKLIVQPGKKYFGEKFGEKNK